MYAFDLVAKSPSDLPLGARIFPITAHCGPILDICRAVRSDVQFLLEPGRLSPNDWLMASGPSFLNDLVLARSASLRQPAIVFPAVGGSYHEYFDVPLSLLRHAPGCGLFVTLEAMTNYVTSLGPFFGETVDGKFQHQRIRYQPQLRMSTQPRTKIDAVLAMLADAEVVPISSQRSALDRSRCGNIGGEIFTMECNISITCRLSLPARF